MELLQSLNIRDQSTAAKYPDGSGQTEVYDLHISISGHGSLLNTEVEKITVGRGGVFILAKGSRSLKAEGA